MNDAPKTTYQDLTSTNQAGVNALINTLTQPLPGTYWAGQGGIYTGIVRDAGHYYHLIMATTAFSGTWGKYPNEIAGEFSYSNGAHNTQLILTAEPENTLCLAITNHEADSHRDFYLPSSFENNLICINAREHIAHEWHWSSNQYSARYAWYQTFEDGGQDVCYKDFSLAARAVRRVLII